MANHNRAGLALQQYHDRKHRPHRVSGRYVSDGANAKPAVLSLTAYLRKLRLRGASRVGKKGEGATKSGGIVHWRPFHCEGR